METEPQLLSYIHNARASGLSDQVIKSELLRVGWSEEEVVYLFTKVNPDFAMSSAKEKHRSVKKEKGFIVPALASLTALSLILSGFLFYDRTNLSNTNSQKTQEVLTKLTAGGVGFTDAGELLFPDDKLFLGAQEQYINEKRDFVQADLVAMRLSVYKEGEVVREFPILGKGKENSWWETPTGTYSVLLKETNHFSSIGEVWMPWSIQFYGNFFIHGWPYYENGDPVPPGYSGGCIRLATEDAKELYELTSRGMPLLVRDAVNVENFGNYSVETSTVPDVGAYAYLVADVATGETLIEKRSDVVLPIASLTKLMTAVVASELIYLERSISVGNQQTATALSSFQPKTGEQYVTFDLLYPLLMQSSNDAADLIASYLGKDAFVRAMNTKAESIDMKDTHLADPSGISAENVSSTQDVFKLMQYIYFKRKFIFDLSKGKSYQIYSGLREPTIANFNEFVTDEKLVGVKNGETTAAKQTYTSVWEFGEEGRKVPLAITVLRSENRSADVQKLVEWVEKNVEFK